MDNALGIFAKATERRMIMDGYINRGEAIEAVKHAWAKGIEPSQYIEVIPAADVAPVVHGRWVPTKAPFMNECKDCSVCGYRTVWGHRYNYCPNCGAKMDGGNS